VKLICKAGRYAGNTETRPRRGLKFPEGSEKLSDLFLRKGTLMKRQTLKIASRKTRENRMNPLFSEEERQLISLVGLGLEDAVIARFMGVSEERLRDQIKIIFHQLHTYERHRLVIYAWRAEQESRRLARTSHGFRGN
jgi:DNA-binding NarL/FixJ family response regulator